MCLTTVTNVRSVSRRLQRAAEERQSAVVPLAVGAGGGGGRDALEGGEVPPPLQGAQPIPSYSSSDSKCELQWHL